MIDFIKNEIVLIVSFILAVASAFIVTPTQDYITYIDFRTLGLLFSLMIVMAGFSSQGIFRLLAKKLLQKTNTIRGVVFSLVLLCFFSSMIITNDVALITFVPFTIVTLKLADKNDKLIITIVLETIGANLGSMLTPIGNPQNLYLFSRYNMDILDFIKIIYPYALLSLVLLVVCSLFVGKDKIQTLKLQSENIKNFKLVTIYGLLFITSLLGVFRLLNYIIVVCIVIACIFVFNRKIFLKVDYSLLLTFIFLFIFIGNLGNITVVNSWMKEFVNGNEVITGILSSQVFSNVPATLLLSDFTDNFSSLLIGVNLGGLGTLIASMASLISFKFIQNEKIRNGKYVLIFTLYNMAFLMLNLLLYFLIG